jgi:hypothetical protein
MQCRRPNFIHPGLPPGALPGGHGTERPELPDLLTDRLTGREVPFSNKENIRQKTLELLLGEKDYKKGDFVVDREIAFQIDGRSVVSTVDLSIAIAGRTLMIWKCASGSLVSRERQILASARLLEEYIVPFAAVTNGIDLEFLEASSGNVIGCGHGFVPSRGELLKNLSTFPFKPVNKRKLVNEQRILFTYDAISCSTACNNPTGR